jgi:hypothetical protein
MGKLEDKKVFIDNIVDSTLSGDLKWIAEKNLFNTYKRQKYKLILDKDLYINFYNDLSKNFTKKSFRKNKLENILSESPTSNVSSKKETKSEVKSEVKSEIKKEVKSEASDDSSMKLENESLWLLSIPILGMLHYFVTSDSVDNKYLPVLR